jgi:hypothetical protein
MNSTARPREIDDPHDAPAIAPDVVPVTWADRVLADITRDAKTIQPDRQPPHAPAPAVDTTFRAAVPRPSRGKWVASATMAFMFALVSAFAAAGWQHYGDRAKEMIAEWTPIATQFLASSSPADQAVPVEQAAAPADQAAAADQATPPAVSTTRPAEAAAAPAAAATLPSESAELMQSMARDLAAMAQQVEQLKASIAELKANQQPATPVIARTSEAKPAEIRPPAPAPVARPKVSAALPPPPPRTAPPPLRRPLPVQAGVAAPMPLTYQPAPPPPAAPPAQATAHPDDEVVVRPPMPLRWGGATE